ncbi:MAG: hypothetical protein AB199_01540 [Parcubacteria bacterium C7867-004]|nr:MAG: hypothetical protein AB199_01540 [Parcubacteria bacterium C7867-004]
MPIIRIDYDKEQIESEEVLRLSHALRDIVSEVTGIQEVFVYADSHEITIKADPLEIFIEMSAHLATDVDALMEEIKKRLSAWKAEVGFTTPINLTIIPMQWKIEIGI